MEEERNLETFNTSSELGSNLKEIILLKLKEKSFKKNSR